MNLKEFYEIEGRRRDVWMEDRQSNKFFQEMIRYDRVLDHLPVKSSVGWLAADLGCGDGYLTYLLTQRGFRVVSIDISKSRLEKLKKRLDNRLVTLLLTDLSNTSLMSNQFDYVIMSEVLEHLIQYEKALAEVYRIIKPGGHFILTVPYKEPIKTVTCPHCLHSFNPDGHVNSFNRENLPSTIEETGFNVEQIMTFRSRITNQLQYHLKIPYGRFIKLLDAFFVALKPEFTFYMLIKAQKPNVDYSNDCFCR